MILLKARATWISATLIDGAEDVLKASKRGPAAV